MATFTKYKNRDGTTTHRAAIARKGYPRKSETFPSKREAELWAAEEEAKMLGGKTPKIITQRRTVLAMIEEYEAQVRANPTSNASTELCRVSKLKTTLAFVGRLVGDVTDYDILRWKQSLHTLVSEHTGRKLAQNTIFREYATLHRIFACAVKEWKWLAVSPCEGVPWPERGEPRTGRWSDGDIARFLVAAEYTPGSVPKTSSHYIACGLMLSVCTTMRCGEVLHLTRDMIDVRANTLTLPPEVTKTKKGRVIPLRPEALALLALLPTKVGRLFPVGRDAWDAQYARLRTLAKLEGKNYHDTRREAITRMVNEDELDALTVAKISGITTMKILLETYYQPNMSRIADRFAARSGKHVVSTLRKKEAA